MNLWDYLYENNLSLSIKISNKKITRVNDKWIMEAFVEKGYDNRNLRIANEARMALQVETLSDMSTADRKKLKKEVFNRKAKPKKERMATTSTSHQRTMEYLGRDGEQNLRSKWKPT